MPPNLKKKKIIFQDAYFYTKMFISYPLLSAVSKFAYLLSTAVMRENMAYILNRAYK